MGKSISVVIPSYNGRELLSANLPALYRALETSGITDFEVIISDDASGDGTAGFVRMEYPGIILMENPVTQGFPGNANKGIRKASKELVLMLNTDVKLNEKYFVPLLPYFDDPLTFGVMGRITGLGNGRIQDGAKYPDYSYAGINANTNYVYRKPDGGKALSFFLSGANALIDRSKLMLLGGFDEIFGPYYSEDVDLGLRAWRAGYRCCYEHGAVCQHPNAATIRNERAGKVKLIAKRNKMLLHFIHLNGLELFYFLLLLSFKCLFRALVLDLSYCRSFFLFAALVPRAAGSRAGFRALQKRNLTSLSVRNVADLIRRSFSGRELEVF